MLGQLRVETGIMCLPPLNNHTLSKKKCYFLLSHNQVILGFYFLKKSYLGPFQSQHYTTSIT